MAKRTWVLGLLLAQLGCTEAAEPRAQLIVFVDTDAHLVDELASRPEVSPAAAMDTLRVDLLDDSGDADSTQVFAVSDITTWPLSFGIAPIERTLRDVRVRLRLFRADGALDESGQLTPYPEVTVDRLLQLEMPESGLRYIRATLHFDCLGRPVDTQSEATTCASGAALAVGPDAEIDVMETAPTRRTRAGSWPGAIEVACQGPESPDAICIAGGFSILGDRYAIGLEADPRSDPLPLRPVLVSAFRMDRTEYTVGRFRRLLATQGFTGPMPTSGAAAVSAFTQQCSWIDADSADHDDWPLSCIAAESAALICQLEGGMLPTEAQWEHAARGRGESRPFPWGSASPRCCTFSGQRKDNCGYGVEPVGSHVGTACGGVGDVSRDGVVDLAGSLDEIVRDVYASYQEPCWSQPLAVDPYCMESTVRFFGSRGGSWSQPLNQGLAVLRDLYVQGPESGFRCVYPAAEP